MAILAKRKNGARENPKGGWGGVVPPEREG